jgi:hypothetical protein
MFGYQMPHDSYSACDPAQMCQGEYAELDPAQFAQAGYGNGYVMCAMPQAMMDGNFMPVSPCGDATQAAQTESSAVDSMVGAARKTPSFKPLERSTTEPASNSHAATRKSSLKQELLAGTQRLTAAGMQRQAEKARLLRLAAGAKGGAAAMLLAKRQALQQASRGDHSTFSALNIDGAPGAALDKSNKARFLAEMGIKPLGKTEDEKALHKQGSTSSQDTAAPDVDTGASTAEEDATECANSDSAEECYFATSRSMFLSYRGLAEDQVPDLKPLRVVRDPRYEMHHVPVAPPGVFARQNSEPAKAVHMKAGPLQMRRQMTEAHSAQAAAMFERQLSPTLPGSPFVRMLSNRSVSDEERRRRGVQSLLNKVCPENIASVIEKLSSVDVPHAAALEQVIELIFKKALAEPHYCETYADLVFGLKSTFPEFPSVDGSKPTTFKSSVLNICQSEFEELLASPEPSEEERKELEPEELEFRRSQRKNRMRANMRFIGHLFLRQLLSAKVIGSVLCELTLVEQADIVPEEHAIECACELLNAIGFTLESMPAGRAALAAVCKRMIELKAAKTEEGRQAYSKRVQFAMQDILDARAAGWTRKVFKTTAKTKEDIRLEQERDHHAGSNGAEGATVVAGQRPQYLSGVGIGVGA